MKEKYDIRNVKIVNVIDNIRSIAYYIVVLLNPGCRQVKTKRKKTKLTKSA
jgi:hypothetical protein